MDPTEVTSFIEKFNASKNLFLYGCCYWFAWILKHRFGAEIVYEPVEGHFLAFVPNIGAVFPIVFSGKANTLNGRLYDVRGDVSDMYAGYNVYSVEWLRRYEPNWYSHLMRDCRDFIDPTDEEMEAS